MFKTLFTALLLSAAVGNAQAAPWDRADRAKWRGSSPDPAPAPPPPPPPPPGPAPPPPPANAPPPPPTVNSGTAPSTPDGSKLIYVSLGSSFAAGPCISPVTNAAAGRSGENYASVFAASRPELQHVDLSVSGAVLSDLHTTTETTGGVAFPPRVELIPADAALITISAGGNDIGYIGNLGSDANTFGPDNAGVIARYKDAIHTIQAKAPHAKIVLLGYHTLFGSDAKNGQNVPGVPFTSERVAYHASVGMRVREIVVGAAKGEREVWVIPLGAFSEDHGIGSKDPWVNGSNGPRAGGNADDDGASWHPNRRGMRAAAGFLGDWYNQNM